MGSEDPEQVDEQCFPGTDLKFMHEVWKKNGVKIEPQR